MASYTLQTSEIATGTVVIKITSPLGGLTIPDAQTLMITSELIESLDTLPGVTQVEEIDLDYIDDYTTYAEGFWHKVLAELYVDIQLTLDEGSGATHLFYGRNLKSATSQEEFDLTPSAFQRKGTIHCLSFLTVLKSLSLADLDTAINGQAYIVQPATQNGSALLSGQSDWVSLRDLMAQALATATGQAFVLADVDAPYVGGVQINDFMFSVSNGTYYGINDTFGVPAIYIDRLSISSAELQQTYPLAWDLISIICKGIGFVPRYRYDIGSDRHRIDLLTRGRSYEDDISLPVPTESTMTDGTPTLVQRIQVTAGASGATDVTGGSGGKSIYFNTDLPSLAPTDVPPAWQADMNIAMEFQSNPYFYASGLPAGLESQPLYFYDVGADDMKFYGCHKYWDYQTDAWVSNQTRMDTSLARYYANRLGGIRRIYERTYATIKADDGSTDSHTNLSLLRTTVINDGVGNRTFYATEVRKDVTKEESFVRWEEV